MEREGGREEREREREEGREEREREEEEEELSSAEALSCGLGSYKQEGLGWV